MKAYGFSRTDKQTCKYGCCGNLGMKHLSYAADVRKRRRKAARRNGKAETKFVIDVQEIIE